MSIFIAVSSKDWVKLINTSKSRYGYLKFISYA